MCSRQILRLEDIADVLICRTNYDEVWVALNWQMRLPTPKTHPEFPLWNLGYTPEQVYDLFFPKSTDPRPNLTSYPRDL